MEKQPKRRKQGTRWLHLTEEEILSVVARLFVRGMKPENIAKHMQDFYGETNFKREEPYKFIRRAAEQGMLSFGRSNVREPGIELNINERFPGLDTLLVVKSVQINDVAEQAANVVLDWLRHRAHTGRHQVRIGLMGGGTVMAVCRALAPALAELPNEEKERWPPLVFQALAVGDNVREPLEDPASFFTYFADPSLNPLRRSYISLHAPVFSARSAAEHELEAREFEELRGEARACDIVLVSAGSFADEHSFLGGLQGTAPASWRQLSDAQCRGDLGRLPVSADGPLDLNLFQHPPCTLVSLHDLQSMVSERRKVMVIAAPCGHCGAHKGDIIETLLALYGKGQRLFNALLCDTRSARSMTLLGTVRSAALR